MRRRLEDIADVLLDRVLVLLCIACGVLGPLAIGAQLGLRDGRLLEREQMAAELAETRKLIDEVGGRLELLEKKALIRKIIGCESSSRHDGVWGDGGRSYGIAQFSRRTFRYLASKSGIGGLDWKSRDDQLALLGWALDNGYGRHWTCFNKIQTAKR